MCKIIIFEIICEKYKHSRHHLEYRRHLIFSELATNLLKLNKTSSITYPKIRTSSLIFVQKICHIEFFGHFEFLRKSFFCIR
jgi:hypothetical protein